MKKKLKKHWKRIKVWKKCIVAILLGFIAAATFELSKTLYGLNVAHSLMYMANIFFFMMLIKLLVEEKAQGKNERANKENIKVFTY